MSNTQRSLGLVLDPARETPLYQQLFDQIAERIRSRAFPPGFRLPPSRKLAEELGAHRNTVVRAYSELEQSGFLLSTVGRGTFVRPQQNGRTADQESPDATRKSTMPWASLMSERSRSEPFSRAHRISHSMPRREFVNLSRLQPSSDLIPDELFRRCVDHVMRTIGPAAMGYAPHEGVPRLRERIAADLERQGVPARPEDVLVTSGSQQALDVIARTLIDTGDVVLAQNSTYAGAIQIFAAAGARLCGVPSDGLGPDSGWLRNLGRAKAMYLMPNHCNPTGGCIAMPRREEIIAWSHETGTPIIEDDYAADLELDDAMPPPAMRALDADVIYVGTFSKKLIPALRIGFLLCPPSLAPQLVSLKHATDLGTSALLQHALSEFLERGYMVAHLNRIREEYRARRDVLVEALRKELPSSVHFDVPARGMSLWLELPEDVDPEAVFDEAQRRGVLVSPGTLNLTNHGSSARNGIRVVFCCEPKSRLIEGAKRLGIAIEALSKSRSRRASGDESFSIV